MKTMKIILLIMIAVFAVSHQSDGQQARPLAEQLRLAGVMPRGALVYLQVRDLNALMKMWTASPKHDAFYNSATYKHYEKSSIYQKFQNRKDDLEKAIGFGIDESRLAEFAGGASAVAMYDIGKLELVFVTEVAREKAIATMLFKNAPQFQERPSKSGAYYVREITTDNGNLRQQFCFAYTDGKLIVTTTEGLMIRALANSKAAGDDAALADVLDIANKVRGFSTHDLTLWVDQKKLNQNRHFKSYWIHHNSNEQAADSLAKIDSGLLDLRFSTEGINEQRWFKMTEAGGKTATLSSEQATAFARFAPADAHLIEMRAGADEALNEAAAQALFGKEFDESQASAENNSSSSSNSSDETNEKGKRVLAYSNLDARFDRDVDDALAKASVRYPDNKEKAKSQDAKTANPLEAMLKNAVNYSEMARSKDEVGKPFVHFERAVIVEMKSSVDKAALEHTIADEMRDRFVVAGIDPQLTWQEEGVVRYLSQSLLEQSAAYAVSGKYLILASSREFVRDILQASATADAKAKIDGAAEFYAIARVMAAKPVFDKLMKKLDGKSSTPAKADKADTEEEEGDGQEIKFFSDNLSSFIAASAIREMRFRRNTDSGLMSERVTYSW